MADLSPPEPIGRKHLTETFDCGNEALNTYLKQFAFQNHRSGSARTYVTSRGLRVVGYYSLAYGAISHDEATARTRAGLARHPIPVLVIARLAVDQSEQGHGIGKGLLKDALLRTLQAADIAGLRAVIVHAKDEQAKAFYLNLGFESSPIDALHLMLLVKDLRHTITHP